MAESGYVRTKVRTKNPSKGVYRTLDGSHEIRQTKKAGHWDVYRVVQGGAQRIAQGIKGYDRALDRILQEPGVELQQLNTAPPKPKAEAPKVERSESHRRSGATGEAPMAQPKPGRPSVKRSARKIA